MEKREGEKVLGHLFWRTSAKSGHDDCMVNLLQFFSLFFDFLNQRVSLSVGFWAFSVL